MLKDGLKIGNAILWVTIYFGVMLFYTFLDVAVWRKFFPQFSHWINVITITICASGFIASLKKTWYRTTDTTFCEPSLLKSILSNTTPFGIFLAIGCAVLCFLLLDNCLDPIFESIFPQSEQAYQETVQGLMASPITALLQVCVIAPIIEEILMRGFVLGGLKNTYGIPAALLLSSALFALLHFNMVQTLSAFVCGILLGLLYLKTDSIFCCIVAHCGYNFISYIAMVYPLL